MMRIIAITLPSSCSVGYTTILLRSPICVVNSTIGRIIPWFFCQTISFVGELPGNPMAIRIRTETDPFKYLRNRKGPAFDGKGVTLERPHQRPDVIRVDHAIDITVQQIQLQLPGLFCSTADYPNLNLLVSERLFYANINDPEKLWQIMYDCLCCKSFSDRQENDNNFKCKLSNNFHTTLVYDCRPKLAELQEHVESTAERTCLEESLGRMLESVKLLEKNRYTQSVKQDKNLLQLITTAKLEQSDIKNGLELEVNFNMMIEAAQEMIAILKDDLEGMLHVSEIELNQSNFSLAQRIVYETCNGKIDKIICEIEEMHNVIIGATSSASKVDNVQCSIENNLSLQVLAGVTDTHCKDNYLSDLQNQSEMISASIREAQCELEQAKVDISVFAAQMQQLKDRIKRSEDSVNARSIESSKIFDRLQKNLNDILEASMEIARLEKNVLFEEKLARQEYLNITAVGYEELVSIAAANCAINELRPEIEADFEGFIYERTLEIVESCRLVWVEGFSSNAIFKSVGVACRVDHLMKQKYNVHTFYYNVLERCRRSTLQGMIMECAQSSEGDSMQNGFCTMSYEQLIAKVNTVVMHLKHTFEFKQRIKVIRASREHHKSEQQELLEELHRWEQENEQKNVSIPLTFKSNDFPTLMANFANAKNRKSKLHSRYDSLTSLMQMVEHNTLPSDLEQLKLEADRLKEHLTNAHEEDQLNRKRFFGNLTQFTNACELLQFELDRFDEHGFACSLSSGTYKSMVDYWSSCGASLGRAIQMIDAISRENVPLEMTTSLEALDAVDSKIQSINLRKNTLTAQLEASQNALNQYLEEHSSLQSKKCFAARQYASTDCNDLLEKISQAQQQLKTMPPAYKPTEIDRIKKKIKVLRELEKLQSTFRDLHLNNIILPVIDKLHVRTLQQISKLVAAVSTDLPELAGTVKIFFSYQGDGEETNGHGRRMSVRLGSFRTNQIAAVNISIFDENGVELDKIHNYQRNLAYLLLFISFLYATGCKLFIIDEKMQILFDNGILSMMNVFEKHFPAMQFIILENSSE